MTTHSDTAPAPDVKSSLLYKMAGPKRRASPESTRLSFMLLLSMTAAGISTYLLSVMDGVTFARFVVACVVGGWVALSAHLVRAGGSAARG